MISSSLVEKSLRELLLKEGYQLNSLRKYGETGVDILAKKGRKVLHIEVIGFKTSPPARSKDFYQVFFRAISRLDDGAKHCVIALPKRFELGLPARVKQYKIAWSRLTNAFPELEIWLIDTGANISEKTRWGDWLSGHKKQGRF